MRRVNENRRCVRFQVALVCEESGEATTMRINSFAAIAAAAFLGGCVAQADTVAEDPLVWGRVDCQLIAGNAMLQADFEQARTICVARGQAASVATTANMPNGYGMGGAMVAGMNKGIAGSQVTIATVGGCMGEMGYLQKPKSQHVAMCEAIADQKQRMAAAAAPSPAVKKRAAPVAKPQALTPPADTPARP